MSLLLTRLPAPRHDKQVSASARPAPGLFPAGEGRGEGGRSPRASFSPFAHFLRSLAVLLLIASTAHAQTLLNIDFGVGSASRKTGPAATGQATNDFWNLYRHYDPKFTPGQPLVARGELKSLKLADGSDTKISVAVTNAPGVWGNASGDAMFDTFIFSQNGSNITVALHGLDPGQYQFYLYGHADPDVTGEQNSIFTIRSGTNANGPLTTLGVNGWKAAAGWQERYQFVVFRDVPVVAGTPVFIEVAAGPGGIPVLNGLQVISRGTSPPRLVAAPAARPPAVLTNLLVHQVAYDGKVTDSEARFAVTLDVESMTTNEISRILFEGDVAVLVNEIPAGLRIVSGAKQYRLICTAPGSYKLNLELVAKITRAEPWNQISFHGPIAAIASVSAAASAAGVEMQLLSGTQLEPDTKAASKVSGFLGHDRLLSLRWQSKTAEVARKSLVTVDTLATAQVTPTVIKFTTQFRYEILQAPVPRLTIGLPTAHALTKVQGEQIRDWSVKADGARQLLTIEFVKPVEKSYTLTLLSEQPVETTPVTAQILPPQPLDIERESGSFSLSAADTLVEIDSTAGLRQVNAAAGTLAAYRFFGRPLALAAKLRRIEPVVKIHDRVAARLEEGRLLVHHSLAANVEKAGIYALEFTPQAGFVVADVRGEGIDDWKVTDGKLRVNFTAKVLGQRTLSVQLELPYKTFTNQFAIAPLRATGATNETATIGAASALGIRLKTAGELTGLREIPVSAFASGAGVPPASPGVSPVIQQRDPGETPTLAGGTPAPLQLAFTADAGDWSLSLAAERLPARVVADVFNLVTVGDGLIGGSAIIRYGIINQGVQEFRVKLPGHWKNTEFTGPGIRRKELLTNIASLLTNYPSLTTNDALWAITLQDKAWGGYTLVITYDHQFDSKQAALDLAGAYALDVERETGSVALVAAASLQLKPRPTTEPLRLIDQSELAETDRALVTRPVLLAWRYAGGDFALTADVLRHDELQGLLNAVADRTQISSVLTEEGQMLSQASFMVKNNDKQFQKFQLPSGASLWGCYVNNQPVKAEQDGAWLLVSLPRGANRDEAFAVDIVYKQTLDALKSGLIPRSVALAAPTTDVPNTYAEWQVYLPPTRKVSSFGGTMNVMRGTEYGLRDAWSRFSTFYGEVFSEHGGMIIFFGGGLVLLVVLIGASVKRGKSGFITILGGFAVLMLAVAMLLPSLAKTKARAQRISSMSNLKQVGLAARMFAEENNGYLPNSFEEFTKELGSEKSVIDPLTGERFAYVGAGKRADNPNAIVAYSPVDLNGRVTCFADGRVEQLTSAQFAEALQREAGTPAVVVNAPLSAEQAQALGRQQGGQGGRGPAPNAPPAIDPATGLPVPAGQASFVGEVSIDPSTGLPVARNVMFVTNGFAAGFGANGGVAGGRQDFQNRMGQVVTRAASGPSGGAGGGGGAVGGGAGAGVPPSAPTVAGLRSIRIDIPRSGQPFTFTKVLNISDEPLLVKMSVMKLETFRTVRSALQLLCFVGGLLIVWREWRREPRRSFTQALGLALALGAVGHLGVSLRVLHSWLILAAPAALGALCLWALWKYWPRRAPKPATVEAPSAPETPTPDPTGPSPVPPTVATVALLLSLTFATTARAQDDEDQSAIRNPKSAITNAVSITSASYTGTVREKVAQFDATLQFSSVGTNETITLFGEEVAVQQFTTDAKEAKLLRRGKGVALRLAEKGNATVQFKLLVKLGGDVTKRQLDFAIPPALSSRLKVTLDEPDADVEFPTAVAFQRATDKKETRVDAILGAGDRVEIYWTPRMKRIAEMAASIFAQNATLVTLGGGVMNTRSTLDYQVTQGELRQVKVKLPAGQRLLRVEGELIRVWELNDDAGGQVLTVDLVKGVSPGYRLTVEMEKILDKLPASAKVETPHVMDVIRETGLLAVRGGEELSLGIESATDLQRVDAAEFGKAAPFKADGVLSAYRFLRQDFALTVRAEAIQPQVEAAARNAFRIGFEEITLAATVDYTIKKAGVFTLRLALPDGFKVQGVAGNGIAQWTEKESPRGLEVILKERSMGLYALRVELTKAHKELPKTIALAGVTPLDVLKLAGFVSVTSEPGVAVKTTGFDALTEIPAATLGENRAGGSSVQAFKLVGTDPATAGAWKLALATETVESWVRAEVVNVVSVTETLVSGRAVVRYEIQNAPVKDFRLRVPTNYANVEITGANVRRRDQTNDTWRVELQSKVRGTFYLTVTWEQPRGAATNATALGFAGVEALGVERETGEVVFLAKPPLQIVETKISETLLRIDARELPSWAGVATGNAAAGSEVPVLVYRYLRPGYALALEAKRFDEAAVLQALVDSARLTTVVADDGQMLTEMTLGIRNNGLQHLEVELPAGSQVWSAFVAGQPVRPTTRGAKLLLPLERSGADEAPVSVELTFVGSQKFPRGKGEVKLESPKLDVPLKNARWDVYLPPDYAYAKFDGSMTHEADAAPVVQVYSSRDYAKQEQEKRAAKTVEFNNSLSNARKNLAEGNLYQANIELRNASGNSPAGSQGAELKMLADLDLDQTAGQAGNLIKAQRDYTFYNAGRISGKGAVQLPAQQVAQQAAEQVNYDVESAQQQWGALQRAQSVTVAKVQPLRANLPTRGQRHVFSQVLQTEVNKPMTIQFSAANTKAGGWFRNTLYVLGGFVMLWIFASVVLRRPPPSRDGRAVA